MDAKKILLILTILVGFRTNTAEVSIVEPDTFIDSTEFVEAHRVRDYAEAYTMLIDTLKWHEGYRAYPYKCLAEVWTVGYGHAIRDCDEFDYPMSEEEADSLLRVDLDWAIEFVESSTDLQHTQLLAIAHFVFALGSGNFQRSTLRELIANDLPIDEEIVKWVHIRTRDGIIRSEHLVGSRRMELKLYNT